MPEKISIVKDTGETISSNIMSVFMIPETNKQYIITTENAVDPHGLTVLHVSEIEKDKLVKVRTDDEWASIKTIMRAIISASVGSYVYIPVINNATVEGQYSRDISVSAGAAKQLLDSYINGKKEVPPSSEPEGGVSSNAIESDSIFPTAPNVNDQDNEIVPGIEEVDNSADIEANIIQTEVTDGNIVPVTDVVAAVPEVDNNIDSVSEVVSSQVAAENANPIDIPIIDENTQPVAAEPVVDGNVSQPFVDSPIVSEVVTSSAPNVVVPVDGVVPAPEAGNVQPVDNAVIPVEGIPQVDDVANVDAIPGVVSVNEAVDTPVVETPVQDIALPDAPLEGAPVVDAPVMDIPAVDSAATKDIAVPTDAQSIDLPVVDEAPVVDTVATDGEVAPVVEEKNDTEEKVVVSPTVSIDTDAITNSLKETISENITNTITDEMGKIVAPSIESSVENNVSTAVEKAINNVVDEKVKNPIEQKIEEVMNKVVEEKVQAPLMDTVTKTVNDTIEKQSKALNSLGIKLDFGVQSSFGKNASLDEIVAGSQELFVEGVKNLIMVMTERVYKELRIKEEELKRREIIVAQREQAVNDKTMAMLNGTYDPTAFASTTPSVIPTTANIPVATPAPASVVPTPVPAAPVAEAAPSVPASPVVETAPSVSAAPVAATPTVEPVPVVETAPVVGAAPVVEAVPAPVAEAVQTVEAVPAAPVVEAAPAAPVVEATPAVEPVVATPVVDSVVPAPAVEPVVATSAVETVPVAPVVPAEEPAVTVNVVGATPADPATPV